MSQQIDVVYKVGATSKWGRAKDELRYSIRSVAENFKNLRDIVIVGVKPDWIKNVRHIPCDDPYQKNKDANIIRKILTACADEKITEDFVNISDDQLIIYPLPVALLKPYTINSDIRKIKRSAAKAVLVKNSKGRIKRRSAVNEYGIRVLHTLSALEKEGLPTNLYEGHVPYLINKTKYPEIVSKYDYVSGKGMCGNTLYFNNLLDNKEYPVENVRGFAKGSMPTGAIISQFTGKLFFCYQKAGLTNHLKSYIRNKFRRKCIYEK